jgi:Zn-dependent protease
VSEISLAQGFIVFVVLLFSLAIHEFAHAWTADRLGDPTARRLGRVSLNPMVHADPIGTLLFPLLAAVAGAPLIGWAKPVPVNVARLGRPRRDYMVVAAAGPASNLVLAIGAAAAMHLVPASVDVFSGPTIAVWIAVLLQRAIQLNVLLAVFNMIPIPPLDGGTVLAGLLPERLAAGFDLLRPYGFLLLCVLMFSGRLQYLVAPPYRLFLSWLP